MRFIDISRDVLSSPVYPGDPVPEHRFVGRIENGDSCNLSVISMCTHNATHMDAPLHFLESGETIEKLEAELFIGPCTVIEVPAGIISGEYVDCMFPKNYERVLIKGRGAAFFMESAAQAAAEIPLKLIGTDALSVGYKGNQIKPHKAFLQNRVAVLEGLDLSGVSPGDYYLFAAPMKISGSEAAPVRAFLAEGHIFWGGKSNL